MEPATLLVPSKLLKTSNKTTQTYTDKDYFTHSPTLQFQHTVLEGPDVEYPMDNNDFTSLPGDDVVSVVDDSTTQEASLQQQTSEQCKHNYDVKFHRILNMTSDTLFRILIKIGDLEVPAVVDSGAHSSLMSSEICKALNIPIKSEQVNITPLADDSKPMVGVVSCGFSLGDCREYEHVFEVFPTEMNPRVKILLGIDFFKNNSFKISPARNLLTKYENRGRIEYYYESSGVLRDVILVDIPCYSSSHCSLVPGTLNILETKCDLPSNLNKDVLFTPANRGNGGQGFDGVYDPKSKLVLFSNHDENLQIQKGELLGSLSTILELPDEQDVNNNDVEPLIVENAVKLPELDGEQSEMVYKMLNDNELKRVFSTNEKDIGRARVTEHQIKLTDETPIYTRPRRFPPPVADEIQKHIELLTDLDLIEPSDSQFSSPIVPVRKHGGGIRLCVDYRRLNAVTTADKFPVPNLSDSIFGLHGTMFFTRLDLVKAYHQIPIAHESRKYTAFSSQTSHHQFKVLPFGLKNAPAAFQREIRGILKAFPNNKVIAYLDDILILSSSFQEHIELVSEVLRTLANYCVKINAGKCDWFRSEVQYIRHVVGRSGIRKTKDYMNDVGKFELPATVGELRAFLGLVNFQRKFVANCSQMQKPLSAQLAGGKAKKSDKRRIKIQ